MNRRIGRTGRTGIRQHGRFIGIRSGNHRRRPQIDLAQQVDLLLRRIGPDRPIDEPRRTELRITAHRLRRTVRTRDDRITGVEHVQHAVVHVVQITVDQILVTGQFRPVIPAHRPMEIARRGIVKGADRQIEHAESKRRIGQNLPIGFGHRNLPATGRHEIVGRKEPPVYGHQVEQHHRRKHAHERTPPDAPQSEQRNGPRRQDDHQQRTPRIGLHHGGPVGGHRSGRRFAPFDVQPAIDIALQLIRLENPGELVGHHRGVGLFAEIEQCAARHRKEQAKAAREASGPGQCPPQPFARHLVAPQPHQGQRPRQRHDPLHDDERHRNRPEFVVAGQPVEEQFGEPH